MRDRRNVQVAALLAVASIGLSGCSSTVEYAIPDGDRKAVIRPSSTSAVVAAPNIDQPIEPGQLYVPAIDINTKILSLPTEMAPAPFLGGQVVTSFGVPPDLTHTAWWSDGPQIGGPGMAVIVGHSSGDPERYGVFNKLLELKPGDEIVAESPTGEAAVRFTVIEVVAGIPKTDPTALSKALSEHPEHARLALLTCEGALDENVAESPDNTIVFATRA